MTLPIFLRPLPLFAFILLSLWLCLAAPALAQAQGADAVATEESASDPQQALAQLIEVLRDDAARDALIAELEANLATQGAEATAATEEQSPAEELRSFGSQIADFTRETVESVARSLSQLWRQLTNVPSIFAGLNIGELEGVGAILGHIAILVVITYGGLILLRRLGAGPRARLRHLFRRGGWVAKPVALVLELVLDIVAALIPYALGYTVAVSILGIPGQISLEHSLYLNAFLMVEIVLAVLRTVLSPNEAEQRLVHVSDASARSIMGWSRLLVSLFVFGQMMLLPLVTATISFAAGRAISVVMVLITLLTAAIGVLVAREPVRRKLMTFVSNNEARRGLSLPIQYWHVLALLYIAVLAIVALTRSSPQFQAYLWSNAQIGIAVLVGFIILNIIKRVTANGITLPEPIRRRSPELQRQLNGIVPVVLKVVRFIVIAVVVIVCLHGLGFFNFVEFVESEFGARVAGSTITILMILALAIIAWIALNAWVDSQVNPELAPRATARKRTLFALMRNALTIAIIVITLMFVLSEVGINIAPLLASAGVIGLAIGFGAQKLVQDIITGIFIQLEGAIDVGDVVAVGGISGSVERLTIRSVSLRDVEGSYHIIPFSSVDTVTNFMRGFSYALIDMGVGYRENVEDARQAMLDAFEELRADPEHKNVIIADFEWMGINAFGPSEVVLRARIKTLPGKQWAVKRAYSAIVKRLFDERDIEIPFPHQTLYFGVGKDGKAPPLHMIRDDSENAEAETLPSEQTPPAPARKRRPQGKQIEGKDMPDIDAGPGEDDDR
ncbi:mechanosensitive ion channel [Pelagibacterium sp. 26DY04]|uniref:mechanosensitive ion channel domain-containing protein n=1 Tax=Pelagibacterium sp. 26DY04 TaxID=2967130 RepID=UPI0028160E98|nr:mechanosensitive ion channel domain-containing protein [Pelagibacterium sp. 26DY04]WMT87248.1 mechanosensitive ion channel [Pelagibacterium sp. 26DY04]